MANADNHESLTRQNLPVSGADVTVRDVLGLPSLTGTRVLAGTEGLERIVSRVNVMEVPDILPWVRAQELLITTGYPLQDSQIDFCDLVRQFAERDLAGVGVKSGRYLDEIPREVLSTADEVGLPVLLLPDGAGFDEIIHEVLGTVLARREQDLQQAEEVLHELVTIVVTGGELDEVCSRIASHVNGTIVVTTMDGRVTEAAGQLPLTRLQQLSCFDVSGRFHVEQTPVGEVQRTSGLYSLAVRIRGGARDLGRLVLFTDHPMSPSQQHVVDQASAAAALVLTKMHAVSAVESKYKADFVHDVLRGRIVSADRILSHATSLGWDLDRELVVVVAEYDDPGEPVETMEKQSLQERFARAWTSAVGQDDAEAVVVGAGDEVTVIAGVASGEAAERTIARVERWVGNVHGVGGGGRLTFSTGISRTAADLHGLPVAYQEARKAVDVGRRLYGEQAISHFDALGVFRLLSLIDDEEELHAFISDTLGSLADRTASAADLRETLRVLLDKNLNVAETAREMHFHYNSLRYRISKLERILGPFMTDARRRLAIHLALQAMYLTDLTAGERRRL
ncbi:PucR family transcriptional regulator [Brevibacterium otitidis]|uniref:PucR family transcriptional regulator n=1 Tax=Brevibacterium otitidis TaxID=53364 RepID=A0ABV5X0M7_9MICO|nr:PucR family transcriptional regulator ligand-binding domain-containing protein [Brevibacterium otitidis]